MNPAIIAATKDFTAVQLADLASWCHIESRNRDPKVIEERRIQEEFWKQREAEAAVKDKENKKILKVLQQVVTPGTMLKMRGCKDGNGIREFIRWENDYLVCWQILRRRVWRGKPDGTGGSFVYQDTKSNQVTTHMPDKVARIFVGGKDLPIKNFVK
jgi:hypothetical protein